VTHQILISQFDHFFVKGVPSLSHKSFSTGITLQKVFNGIVTAGGVVLLNSTV
jgi:hypothetical protein